MLWYYHANVALKLISNKHMVRGNFIGAAIVAIIYTVFILMHPLQTKSGNAVILVILNALTIILLAFAFK